MFVRPLFYKLDGRHPVAVDDVRETEVVFRHNRVALSQVLEDVSVSTVFLGIDHSFPVEIDLPPVLFETLVFGGKRDGLMKRYISWALAEQGHLETVKELLEVEHVLEEWRTKILADLQSQFAENAKLDGQWIPQELELDLT